MAHLARAELFAADEVAVVHVMNCVVGQCFLLGDDAVTGKGLRPWRAVDRRRVETPSRREGDRLGGACGATRLICLTCSRRLQATLRIALDATG
jgi:hypothetical protein